MPRAFPFVAAALCVVLTGCGGNACDKLFDAYDTVLDKGEKCFSERTRVSVEAQASDSLRESCGIQYESLNQADRDSAETYADTARSCINGLDACDEDTPEVEFIDSVNACYDEARAKGNAP